MPLIIGIGNEYRSDDAVGLIVARRLRERLADSVTILEQSGDGAALMEAWRGAETVIIFDTVMSGAAPGTIHWFDASAQLLPLNPEVIPMDEPCSALDVDGTRAIEGLMFRLQGRYTILIVTHKMAQARKRDYAKRESARG